MTPDFELKNDSAVLIEWSGATRELEKSPTLQEAQKLIGGYVEPINFRHGKVTGQMLVNEDGLRLQLKPNSVATQLATGFANIYPGAGIVGNVIILTGKKRWT